MLNIYRASAGSGKTYRLTQDYIHLLLDPQRERTYRRILAVTFTNKATDEMKSRILRELHTLAKGEKSGYRAGLTARYRLSAGEVDARARQVLVELLHDYSAFSISTIDSFFQQVIRAFARDIGVNGAYSLELDSDRTLEQAVDNLFLDLSRSENRQLLQWLTQLAEERVEQSESWNMRGSIVDLGREIFKENFQYRAEETNRKLHDRVFLDAYRRDLRGIKSAFEQRVREAAAEALNTVALYGLELTDFKGGTNSPMKQLVPLSRGRIADDKAASLLKLAEGVERCYAARSKDKDAIEAAWAGGLGACLGRLAEAFGKDLALYNSACIALKHLNTLGVLADLAVEIKRLTEEQNAMLIADTNLLLNRIIDNSDAPFVYERTGVRVEHYMIDEFQDTSVLQWKNFRPLVADSLAAGHFNLVVGDVKQSIYRWRNSDWKLLDEQVTHDFRREQLREEHLDTNWRSDRCIVHFNNTLFRRAAQALQDKLDGNMADAFPAGKTPRHLRQRITHAYGHLFQKTSDRAGEGHVRVDFIDQQAGEDGWRQESLARLPALLESLQDRGYRPADIAILVRRNDEERDVMDYLLHHKTTPAARPGYCYDVMGNEGLRVDTAPSVRFLLGVLRLLMRPGDSVQRVVVRYEYLRGRCGLADEEALNACFGGSDEGGGPPFAFMTADEQAGLAEVGHRALYDLVERVVALFGLGEWAGEAVFVQAFQDIVLRFTSGRATDLHSFLAWWEKNGEKQCVPAPDGGQAVRIMTIHKSKGLDFPVVVIPFCDWKLDRNGKGDILWCEPQRAPFNRFPLLPLEYGARLGRSVFAAEFFNEQMHQYIDSLNMAYVAFTRAAHELVCVAPAPKKEPGDASRAGTLAALLYACLRQPAATGDDGTLDLAAHYEEGERRFELGADTVCPPAADQPAAAVNLRRYPVTDPAGRLQVRHLGMDFWLEGQQLTDSAVNYGTVMHRLLQSVRHRGDAERALRECLLGGLVSEADLPLVRGELARFWQLPHVDEWFAPDAVVMNEATILTPDGRQYRPDRVVLRGGVATVVDYKFGDRERPAYHDQVRQYMRLVQQMGYRARGFLCYVSIGKVVEVES